MGAQVTHITIVYWRYGREGGTTRAHSRGGGQGGAPSPRRGSAYVAEVEHALGPDGKAGVDLPPQLGLGDVVLRDPAVRHRVEEVPESDARPEPGLPQHHQVVNVTLEALPRHNTGVTGHQKINFKKISTQQGRAPGTSHRSKHGCWHHRVRKNTGRMAGSDGFTLDAQPWSCSRPSTQSRGSGPR